MKYFSALLANTYIYKALYRIEIEWYNGLPSIRQKYYQFPASAWTEQREAVDEQ